MDNFVSKTRAAGHKSGATTKEREREYKGVYHANGDRLFCTSCNLVVDHSRKITLDRHLKSTKHLKRCSEINCEKTPKKQHTIPTTLRNQTVAEQSRIKTTHDWVEALVSANVPLIKSDHPRVRGFLNNHVTNGGSIPGYNQLQDQYMPSVFECEKQKLIDLLMDKKIAVIFDEMSDDEGRFVLNILFAPLEVDSNNRIIAYLADTVFLQATNHYSWTSRG